MRIQAPAKINFGLWIGKKRPDGYHPISTLFLPVSLYDAVTVETTGSGEIQLECSDETIPAGSRNLCWKAAVLFRTRTQTDAGISIKLDKRIPAGAGLGGGSSDAAAVLMGLNMLIFGVMTDERLMSMAAELGADVPFFLYRRPCAAKGIGEILTPVDFPWDASVLIILPKYAISTPDAYGAFDMAGTDTGPEIDFSEILRNLDSLSVAENQVRNDFEPVLFPHNFDLEETKKHLYDEGAEYASLSGSGSAVYGLFESDEKAREAEKRFTKTHRTFAASVIRNIADSEIFLS